MERQLSCDSSGVEWYPESRIWYLTRTSNASSFACSWGEPRVVPVSHRRNRLDEGVQPGMMLSFLSGQIRFDGLLQMPFFRIFGLDQPRCDDREQQHAADDRQ